jgi:pimeloyl-ACP methyl ester carboxylesterase
MAVIALSLACLGLLVAVGLAVFSRHVARKVEAALPPLGQFLDLGDTRIHYLDEGAGPPIVLVHGLGGQMRNFTALRQALQRHGYRTISIDRPGSGHSTRPWNAPAGPRAQARILAEILQRLGLARPLILGHSLGGAVALALALDFPDAAGGLVLLAPATQPQADVPAPFRRLAIRSPLLRRLAAWTIAVPLGIAQGKATLQAVFAPEHPPGDFPFTGGGLLSLRPTAFHAASTDLIAANGDMRGLIERYAALRLPVGVLFGTADQILDCERHALPLSGQIASVELELVEGAGHMLPVTCVDAVVTLVDRIGTRVEAYDGPATDHEPLQAAQEMTR